MNMCDGSKQKDKIRVGFFIKDDFKNWLGGINYFKTLIETILDLPERKIEPVVFCARKYVPQVKELFQDSEIIASAFLDRWSPSWTVRNIVKRCFLKDMLLRRFFLRHGIDVLSHAGPAVSHTGLPMIGWIPDFQHRHLPQFFPPSEIRKRDRLFLRLCRLSDGIIVSSRAAQQDLIQFYPKSAGKSFVLNFVPRSEAGAEHISVQELVAKYKIPCNYFHLPNQLWAHKNHALVIEALRILKRRGKQIHVVATGNTKDTRNPEFYEELISQVTSYGISDNFIILGIVPFKDTMAIMRHAVAVINPSFFEGWSTTVEEAKSMGKKIVLSDIPVHREQNPERGVYVNTRDPDALADALEALKNDFDPAIEKHFEEKAKSELPYRRLAFGRQYQHIIIEVIQRFNAKRQQ